MRSKAILLLTAILAVTFTAAGTIQLQDGFIFEGYEIQDENGEVIIGYNSSQANLAFNNDVNMSGQDIEDVGPENINLSDTGDGLTIEEGAYSIVQSGVGSDEIAPNSVTLSELDDSSIAITDLDSPDSDLDMNSQSILDIGDLQGNNIVDSTQIESSSVGSDEVDESDSYDLEWSNLALSRSDISAGDVGLAEGLTESGSDIQLDADDLDSTGGLLQGVVGTNELDSNAVDESVVDSLDINDEVFVNVGDLAMLDSVSDEEVHINLESVDDSGELAAEDFSDLDLDTDGSLEDNSVDNSVLNLNRLDVAGGSTGDQGDEGFSVNSDGDVMFGGDLIFPGNVTVADAQEIEGDIMPESTEMFSIGSDNSRWQGITVQNIDASGNVDLPTGVITNSELDSNAVDESVIDSLDISDDVFVNVGDLALQNEVDDSDLSSGFEIDSGQLDDSDSYSLILGSDGDVDTDALNIDADTLGIDGDGNLVVASIGSDQIETDSIRDDEIDSISLSSISDSGDLAARDNVGDDDLTDTFEIGDNEVMITLESVDDSGDLAAQDNVDGSDIESNSVTDNEIDQADVNCLGEHC